MTETFDTSTAKPTTKRSWQRQTKSKLDELRFPRSDDSARAAHDTLLGFTCLTYPRYKRAAHLAQLAAHLSLVERGDISRLLITMPPRHGKSELCSIRFPAWYLGRNPDKRVVIASYAADLAERFSRHVRRVVSDSEYRCIFPDVDLSADSRSVSTWDLARFSGGLRAVGVGGPLTGHGANLLIIDDPIKNRQEAESAVVRNSIWDWYTSTAYTRLEDRGAVVLVMTRWHDDDLMGRLLKQEANGQGDRWHKLHLPALDDEGNALWPEKYTAEDLTRIRDAVGPYDWTALYMGEPTPKEGAQFKVGRLEYIDRAEVPEGLNRCRAWDMAATVQGNRTAGVLIGGPDAAGLWYILDVVLGQWATDDRDRVIRETAARDGHGVTIHGPVDPGAAGVQAAQAFTRMLAGYYVLTERVSGPKPTRADPLSAQINAGNVRIVRGSWNRDFIDELRSFPLGAYDDQVDASADAFNWLSANSGQVYLPPVY